MGSGFQLHCPLRPVLLKVLLHLTLAGQAGTTGNASHEPLGARGDEDLLEHPFYLLESDLLESTALVCLYRTIITRSASYKRGRAMHG